MRLQRKGNLKKARIEIILHDRYDLFSAGLLYDLNALHVASLSLRAGSKKPLGRRIMETLHFWTHLLAGVITGRVIFIMSFPGVVLMYEPRSPSIRNGMAAGSHPVRKLNA